LYSALHGIQTTLKCSDMDHSFTCNKHHACLLPHKRSPDGASKNWGGEHLIAAHYSLSTPKGWKAELADPQRTVYPHSGHPLAEGRAQVHSIQTW